MSEGFGSGPLVGREADLATVRAAIEGPGGGAMVIADSGMGKTALARAVVDRLGERVHPVWVYASQTLSGIPFGALAPHLAPLSAQDSGSVLAAMRSLKTQFRKQSADGTRMLLIIDDVQELDESSAVLAAQLVTSGTAKVLALAKSRNPLPQEILSLISDRLLSRHVLRPLDEHQVAQLCREQLGGEILPSSSAAISAISRGNPMFVLALLAQGRRDGALTERNGVWMLTRQQLSTDLRLRDLVKGHLGRHTEASRAVLETVALAEPVPLPALLQLVPGDRVDALVQDGIITVDPGIDRLVRIAHPLYGEVIRTMVPAGRSRQIRQRIVSLPGAQEPAGRQFLRFVDWSLDCGEPVPAGRLLAGAALANRYLDSRRALRAAAAVTEAAYLDAARLEAARAHVHADDHERARQALDGILDRSTDLRMIRAAALLEAQLCVAGSSFSALAELAGRWSAAADRAVPADTTGRLRGLARAAQTGARLLGLYALVLEGRYAEAEGDLRRVLADSAGQQSIAMAAKALLGDVLIATGRVDAGLKLTGEAMRLLPADGDLLWVHYEYLLTTHVLGMSRRGSWSRIPAAMGRYAAMASRGQIRFGAPACLADAVVELGQRRLPEGRRKLRTAIEGLAVCDRQRLLPVALAVGAYAAALAADQEAARGYLDRLSGLQYEARAQLRPLAAGYAAAARTLCGDGAAVEDLRKAIGEASSMGWTSTAQDLCMVAVRVGDLAAVEQLFTVSGQAEGGAAASLHEFARAFLAADVAGLQSLHGRAPNGRFVPLAIESLERSRLLPGIPAAAQELAARLLPGLERSDVLRREPGSRAASGHPVVAAPHGVKLTRRERDIAGLVAQGKRNSQIARELSVSVRTVEGHIYRTFNKLGISRREELTPDLIPG